MKVLALLEEMEDIVDSASAVPLTGKIMVDPNFVFEIIREIKDALPNEFQQAQWIKNEKDRILNEAKQEYDAVIIEAERRAEELINENRINIEAQKRALEITRVTETNTKALKMNTYGYIDNLLYDFQEKMDMLNVKYFTEMFENLSGTFEEINLTLAANRKEIKDMAYSTQMDIEKREIEQ